MIQKNNWIILSLITGDEKKGKGINMGKKIELEELKEEIQTKREQLNRIISQGSDKERILKFSQELDELISKYYSHGA